MSLIAQNFQICRVWTTIAVEPSFAHDGGYARDYYENSHVTHDGMRTTGLHIYALPAVPRTSASAADLARTVMGIGP
jgi:hypothetical protein